MTPDLFWMLVRISVILTVSGIIAWCMLRITHCRSARLHRVVWGIVLLQGVLWVRVPLELPVLAPQLPPPETVSHGVAPNALTMPNFWQHATHVENIERTEASATAAQVIPQNIAPANATPKITMRFETMLLTVWGFGICVVLMLRTICGMQVLWQLRNATSASERDLIEWQTILHDAGLRPNKIRMLITGRLGPAMIWLPTGYCVLVPRSLWEESDEAVRRGILRHELSHYTHHDGIKSTLAFLIAALHWFNPMAWYAMRQFGNAAEWRCDSEAYGDEPDAVVAFAESMLALHKTADRYVAFLPAFKNRDLTVRIRRLQEHQTGKKESIMKKLLITAFAALLLCCGAFKINLVAKPAAEETQASQKEAKVVAEEKQNQGTLDPNWVNVKGKAILPDGTPAKGFKLMFGGVSKKAKGHANLSNNIVKEDGSISMKIFPDCDYMIAVLDPDGKWAAPYLTFSVDDKDLEQELVFQFEPGVKIEGTVRDKTTGKPIPNLKIVLHQKSNEVGNHVIFDKLTDKNGHYEFQVVPKGEFYVTVGLGLSIAYGKSFEKPNARDYEKKINFGDRKTVNVDFTIPDAFVGKVLRTDGKPAQDILVQIHQYRAGDYGSDSVNTDAEGKFVIPKRPQNVVVKVYPRGASGTFIHWFDDDLPKDGEAVFQLKPSCRIKGRLFDAVTDKPLADQLLFYGYSDKDDPSRKEYMPGTVTTDADGYFTIGEIPADVRYNLFVVPGRQENYGGPYEPFVEVANVLPEKDGETVELGDVKIDLANTKEKPLSEEMRKAKRMEDMMSILGDDFRKSIMKMTQEWKLKLENGEINAVLLGFASRDYHGPFMKQLANQKALLESCEVHIEILEDIASEEKLAELLKKYDDFPKVEIVLLALEDGKEKKPEGINTQLLRGEKDSAWNVPADDPSNQGDWKNSPTGINPKILENFLRDCLQKNKAGK